MYPAILDIADVNDDPLLMLDISGQARPATVTQKDVGCDEFATGTISNHPLKVTDVGPMYKGGPSTDVSNGYTKKQKNGMPTGFILFECFPNPFNPTTTIRFTIPSAGIVTLKIVNAIGQEIAILFNEKAEPGRENRVQFDASNLASGLYFSCLEYNGSVQSKKMLLLK
jgi:hypothetical protein